MPKEIIIPRVEIAQLVESDFNFLRGQVNTNLPQAEREAQWNTQQLAMLRQHAIDFGLRTDTEALRFVSVYLEEQHAMVVRMNREIDQRDRMRQMVTNTVVRATIWDIIFQIFR